MLYELVSSKERQFLISGSVGTRPDGKLITFEHVEEACCNWQRVQQSPLPFRLFRGREIGGRPIAAPGPDCRSAEPTVTTAWLLVGALDPNTRGAWDRIEDLGSAVAAAAGLLPYKAEFNGQTRDYRPKKAGLIP